MDKCLKISILVFSILILNISNLHSQKQDYKFRHLTTKDGLPSNYIKSIEKDSYGFMWFGTTNGLARYDGYNVKAYIIPEDSTSLSNSQVINDVSEDDQGRLWVGTQDRGLLLFDRVTETFYAYPCDQDDLGSLSHNSVNTIYQDREGKLWIGTNGGGLNKFDAEKQQFIRYLQEPEHPGKLNDLVTSVFEDNTGNLWIGTGDGIYLFDQEKESFSRFDLGVDVPEGGYRRINCISDDDYGNLWIGSEWGLFEYDQRNELKINYLSPLGDDYFNGISLPGPYICNLFVTSIISSAPDNPDILWIATRWGLNKFSVGKGLIQYFQADQNNPKSISTNQLDDLYLDDDRQLWIGTLDAGVEILNTHPNPFQQVRLLVSNDLGGECGFSAASFLVDRQGTLWAGGIDGGVYKYERDLNNYSRYSEGFIAPDLRHSNRVDCLYEDSDNNLWLGYYNWGLVLFDRLQETFTKVDLEIKNNVTEPAIIDNLLEDNHEIFWIGTDQGLFYKKLEEGVLSPARSVRNEVLSEAAIIRIFEDSRSNLWISAKNLGLFCLREEDRDSMNFVQYLSGPTGHNGYFDSDFYAIHEDRNGILWLGSGKGLRRFNLTDKTFEADARFNKLCPGKIIQVYGDGQDNLWIFHAKRGLIRYRHYSQESNAIKVFDTESGLPFDKFNTRFSYTNSFYQSADGRLFISGSIGTGGFLWFHPDSIRDNENVPNIVLTAFNPGNREYILDSSIQFKRNITLDYNENFFSFEFSALDFLIPEKNQYAYYLEGYEDDWIYSGNRRFANYTGVPPGEYTFHVKGSNNDGYWNEEGAYIHITILPPFWKTWWAYILYGIVIVLIIYSIIYYYLKRQRLLDKLALEQVEAEKLKELDGMKTRFFTNISHEFRTPLTLILGPIQQLLSRISSPSDKQNLSIVLQNARRLKELVNQLLSLSKLESGKMVLQATEIDLVQFVKSCLQSFESLAGHKKIELSFSSDQETIKAFIDKEKMMQVLNNLLSNAFKFTPEGGRIAIKVSSQIENPDIENTADCLLPTAYLPENCTVISISDTGPGIAVDNLPHIFDRFYQADDSISREQEGTGIGLTIAREMVKLHQGEIEVSSEVGVGTTFRIFLPVGDEHLMEEEKGRRGEEENDESRQSDPPDIENGDMKSSTIHHPPSIIHEGKKPLLLIVEDNPDMRAFIRGYFEDSYQVLEAENGEVGLKMAIEQIPDIVVSDVMMPRMDGYELCHKLKTDEKSSHIPIILLTARASKESRLEGLETGADDFITKPFDGEELQVRVQNLVDQRKKLSEHYQKKFDHIIDIPSEIPLNRDEKFLKKAQDLVESNISNPDYGVESFSSDMALSRVQLHRKLRALVDQSITEFIRTIRLNYAIKLLKNKAGTISEIAYDAGFNNPTYFTISFKKKYGISPSDYLNQLGKK